MTLLNTPARYGLVSLALHWSIVFAILAQWLLAEAESSNALALHQSIGLVVLALAVSVEDEPLRFFNWFDVPRVVVASEDTMEEVHEMLFNILVALAVLHVIGALKHWVAGRRATELR